MLIWSIWQVCDCDLHFAVNDQPEQPQPGVRHRARTTAPPATRAAKACPTGTDWETTRTRGQRSRFRVEPRAWTAPSLTRANRVSGAAAVADTLRAHIHAREREREIERAGPATRVRVLARRRCTFRERLAYRSDAKAGSGQPLSVRRPEPFSTRGQTALQRQFGSGERSLTARSPRGNGFNGMAVKAWTPTANPTDLTCDLIRRSVPLEY